MSAFVDHLGTLGGYSSRH